MKVLGGVLRPLLIAMDCAVIFPHGAYGPDQTKFPLPQFQEILIWILDHFMTLLKLLPKWD